MITPKIRPTGTGQCEVCPDNMPEVETWKTPQGIVMCRKHYDEEQAAYAKDANAKVLIEKFRRSDASISTKGDIHLVNNVPMIELQAAIQNDATIPADKKDEMFADECMNHRARLDQIIFSKRNEHIKLDEEIQVLELERKTWIVNGQEAVGRLRADAQAKYRELNINYAPSAPTKKQKTTKTKTFMPSDKAKFNAKELYAACDKYHVREHVSMIRLNMLKKNISAEQAAHEYANMLGLLD
jgi:hypothetical protein